MNKKFAVLTGAVLMAFAVFVGGCGAGNNSSDKKDLTLAASSFNYDIGRCDDHERSYHEWGYRRILAST